MYVYYILFTCLPTDGYLGFFLPAFGSWEQGFRERPRTGFCLNSFPLIYIVGVGLRDHLGQLTANLLRNCHPVFHSGYTVVYSHQRGMRGSISPHPCQHFGTIYHFYYTYPRGCEVAPYSGEPLHMRTIQPFAAGSPGGLNLPAEVASISQRQFFQGREGTLTGAEKWIDRTH